MKWNETPEQKIARYKKISESQKGRKFSPEHLANLRAAHKRRKWSGPDNPNWNADRIEQAKKHKLSRMIHGFVGRALAHTQKKKIGHGLELLGYSPQQLRSHLENLWKPGMSWENHGKGPGKWHVDHIKPVSDFGSEASVAEINALSNLRPLWEHENLSLGGIQACKIRYSRREKSDSDL